MTENDRKRWDENWAARPDPDGASSSLVELVAPWLPSSGALLDIAGGGSGDAVQFAARGLDVTVVDFSEVGLATTSRLAETARQAVGTVRADLETEPLPTGPWSVITVANFLQRDLFPQLLAALAPGGIVALVIATEQNLERNPHPSARFLLATGEAPGLVSGLEILHHTEAWRDNGRYECWLVAQRGSDASPELG
jgi:tellurite methyltransferase